MRILAEHPDLRRQYEQIVASDKRFGFFSQIWVQDCLHNRWAYVVNKNDQLILRIPLAQKWGIRAFLQPLFLRELQVLCELNAAQLDDLRTFLHARFLLHLNITTISNCKIDGQTGKYQQLKLSKDLDILRKGYSENIKRSLKKATDLQVSALTYTSFQTFFIAQKGANLGQLNAAAWQRLQKLVVSAQEQGFVYCVGAYRNKELVAASLFFSWQDKLYFMKGTLNEEGKKAGALVYLIDAVLEKFADRCEVLDFIGSNQESIATFYRKFGAKDQMYHIVKGRIPLV